MFTVFSYYPSCSEHVLYALLISLMQVNETAFFSASRFFKKAFFYISELNRNK